VIYLALKIFVYLALALCLGGVGGWLLRNLGAMRREEALGRELQEARRNLPALRDALDLRDVALAERDESISALEARLAAQQAVAAEAMTQLEAAPRPGTVPGPPLAHDENAGTLMARMRALQNALERADRALQKERRRVEELQRERELQNRTLHALTQQLEMARTDAA